MSPIMRAARKLRIEFQGSPHYVAELNRLMNHQGLQERFWPQALESIPAEQDADDFAYHALLIMVVKGGAIPPETLGEKRKRRKGLAAQLRRLRTSIKRDAVLNRLHLVDWIELTAAEPVLRILATFKEPRFDTRHRDPFVGVTAREALEQEKLALPSLLKTLEEALASFRPLNQLDDVTHQRYPKETPDPGRRDRQQRLVERHLCGLFERFSSAPKYALVALAAHAVFDSESHPDEIGSRYRRWRRRPPVST